MAKYAEIEIKPSITLDLKITIGIFPQSILYKFPKFILKIIQLYRLHRNGGNLSVCLYNSAAKRQFHA
ncbi:MAG: hypothetical protein ACTSRP_08775 [Candidatus Helarchaeota archaeon]